MHKFILAWRPLAAATFLAAASAGASHAQAITDLTSLYVGYSTQKVQTKPQGELKARLDTLEAAMNAATRAGRTSEVRHLLAKANTLLAGRVWTDSLDFATSLRLRTDRQVIESQRPYTLRVEQTYVPTLELSRSLSAHAALRKRPAGAGAAMRLGDVVKDFPVIAGVSRDLQDAPLSMDLDLRDAPDGNYVFYVELMDSARTLARPALAVVVRRGIDEHAAQLEAAASSAPPSVRSELLYPIDRMRHVNRGLLQLSTFDTDKEFAAADAVLADVKAGKDPFAGKTGDFKRHYMLDAANEVIPFRVYVPTTYTPAQSMPLIVALHGLGGTEDSFFDGYGKALPRLAELNHYIVVAPLGYRVDGSYGAGVGVGATDAAARTRDELSEADVLHVLEIARKAYNIDESRIYLMGHSMGAIGTWSIAAKFPAPWAALGVFSGQSKPANATLMKAIPEFVVHGDADATVNVNGSRTMVAALKAAGAEVMYTEVPGGSHVSVVEPNLAAMFAFFEAHRKLR